MIEKVQVLRARELPKLATPFRVRFSGGWKEITRAELAKRNPDRPDLPRIGVYINGDRLVSWFYADTEVRVKGAVCQG